MPRPVPTPAQVDRDCAAIARLAPTVAKLYRDFEPDGWRRPRYTDQGGGSKGAVSDPTGSAHGAGTKPRAHLARAGECAASALAQLRGAETALVELQEALDAMHPQSVAEPVDERQRPREASLAEVRQARQAQARRAARAGSTPWAATEVTGA